MGLWHAAEQPADEVYLVGMWVATVARGTDVATRLVGTALTHAAASGWRRVVLDVAHENARARAFYARMGFRADRARSAGCRGTRRSPRRRWRSTCRSAPEVHPPRVAVRPRGSWESGRHE